MFGNPATEKLLQNPNRIEAWLGLRTPYLLYYYWGLQLQRYLLYRAIYVRVEGSRMGGEASASRGEAGLPTSFFLIPYSFLLLASD